MQTPSFHVRQLLAVAAFAGMSVPIGVHGQQFTDLSSQFTRIVGLGLSGGEPVVVGTRGDDIDTHRIVRWTPSGGSSELPISSVGFWPLFPQSISADGSAIVVETGQSDSPNRPSAYRWSSADGMVEVSQTRDAPLDVVDRISGDGSTIVGRGNVAGYRWTTSDGLLGAKQIGGRLDEETPEGTFQPEGLSFDGSVVVGGNTLNLDPNQPWNGQAARWTEATGVEYLDGPTDTYSSIATGVSGDGSVIVGHGHFPADPIVGSPQEAFRWTAETGMIPLGFLPGWTDSAATAISGNGLVIIGFAESPDELSARQPFIWTVDFGMRTLEDVLTERGLADEIAGLNLGLINGISADGRYIIGNGRDASGQSSPWLVDLGGFTPVPEPATYGAVSVMGLLALVVWRRRRCVAPADPLG